MNTVILEGCTKTLLIADVSGEGLEPGVREDLLFLVQSSVLLVLAGRMKNTSLQATPTTLPPTGSSGQVLGPQREQGKHMLCLSSVTSLGPV